MKKFNILISEMTDPRWGTRIFVYVEDTLVYVSFLKPRLEDIEEKANNAVNAVLRYFFYKAEQEKSLKKKRNFCDEEEKK